VNVRAAAAVLLALPAAGCGGGGEDGSSGHAAPSAANLTVTLRPAGTDGAARRRRIRCATLGPKATEPVCRNLAGLTADQLAPVPPGTACTQIFGGPQTARVVGRYRGRRLWVTFRRRNGCEINRWARVAFLFPRA
jgi:hypothetical protein